MRAGRIPRVGFSLQMCVFVVLQEEEEEAKKAQDVMKAAASRRYANIYV